MPGGCLVLEVATEAIVDMVLLQIDLLTLTMCCCSEFIRCAFLIMFHDSVLDYSVFLH